MFGLLRRSPRRSPSHALRRTRLTVESLESRYCPSGPSLTLQAQTAAGHAALLSGMVTDGYPAGINVTFSGAVSGSTTTDATGHYYFSTQNASLGPVSAVALDHQGLSSNSASGTLSVSAPTVSLSLAYATRGNVTLTGSVTDLDPGGRTVTFSGVLISSVVTNQDGSFSLTAYPSGPGTIQAIVTDLWGLSSNTAQVAFAPAAPLITGFTATQGILGNWTFSGSVTSPEPEGLIVSLSGLPAVASTTATVQADGSWSVTVRLQPDDSGIVCALTTDWWGQQSNKPGVYVC